MIWRRITGMYMFCTAFSNITAEGYHIRGGSGLKKITT